MYIVIIIQCNDWTVLELVFFRTLNGSRIVDKKERIQIFVIAVDKDIMASSGSDVTGVTDDVRGRMLEVENIKLKSQILTLQEKFTQLSKTNFEQTTRNMSPRIMSMIKKMKTKIMIKKRNRKSNLHRRRFWVWKRNRRAVSYQRKLSLVWSTGEY